MKKIATLLGVLALCMSACSNGATDDKNKNELYPTYDTTDKVDNKNDTKNPGAINAEGDLRHNIDDGENE